MPFVDGATGPGGRVADGLTEDIITRLAKLRVLFVIARGTSTRSASAASAPQRPARILNVDYVASGSVREITTVGSRSSSSSRETRSARASSGPTQLDGAADDTFSVLDAIVDRDRRRDRRGDRDGGMPAARSSSRRARSTRGRPITAASGTCTVSTARTTATPSSSSATRSHLDPTFARAYAGLSFTHFQNAFLDLTPDRDAPDRARVRDRRAQPRRRRPRSGGALGDGPRPVAARRRGRVVRRAGAQHRAQSQLRARSLHARLRSQPDGRSADRDRRDRTTRAQLSPFDPLQFAMLASRALAHVRLGEHEAAATGRSRRPRAPTRTRTSWRSPPSAWPWPTGATRPARSWRASAVIARLQRRGFPARVSVRARNRAPVPPERAEDRLRRLTVTYRMTSS